MSRLPCSTGWSVSVYKGWRMDRKVTVCFVMKEQPNFSFPNNKLRHRNWINVLSDPYVNIYSPFKPFEGKLNPINSNGGKMHEYRFFLKFWVDIIFVGLLIPWFGLWVTSALGFKARVDPLLACFLACMQWIPQIQLWCNTCWRLGGQHCSSAFFIHVLVFLMSIHLTVTTKMWLDFSLRIYEVRRR